MIKGFDRGAVRFIFELLGLGSYIIRCLDQRKNRTLSLVNIELASKEDRISESIIDRCFQCQYLVDNSRYKDFME